MFYIDTGANIHNEGPPNYISPAALNPALTAPFPLGDPASYKIVKMIGLYAEDSALEPQAPK